MNKEYYKKLFPLLNDYNLIPNSDNSEFNCISYSIGIKDKWSWPYDVNTQYIREYNVYWPVKNEISKDAFDEFYEYHGFEKMSLLDFSYDPRYIKVALYTKNGIPKHAAIQKDKIFWESKIGEYGIIKHDLFEIESSSYGELTQIYRKLKNVNETKVLRYNHFVNNLYR